MFMAEKELVRKPPSSEKEKIIKPLKGDDTKIKPEDILKKLENSEFKPFPSSVEQKKSPNPTGKTRNVFAAESAIAVPNSSTSLEKSTQEEGFTEIDKTSKVEETIKALDQAKIDPFIKYEQEYNALSELEKEILTIAKEILKKKKYPAELRVDQIEYISPIVEKLVEKCVAKLTHTRGIAKEEIFKAIQDLEEKQWIVTAQRRTKAEILDTPILKNIITFIHDHPGVHARDDSIEEELNITRNPFIKHIMVLDAFGIIRTKKIGRTQNYFLKDVPEVFDDFVVLFQNPLVPQILRLLLENESIGLSEMARRLGVYHGAIQYHIKALISASLLTKDGSNITVNKPLLKRYNAMYRDPPFNIE